MNDLKKQIQDALIGFSKGKLSVSAANLLNVLGYESERTVQLSPNTYEGFCDLFQSVPSTFDHKKLGIEAIDIIFQLTEDDIKKSHSLFEAKQYSDKIIESYLFFALSLTGDTYTRGDLVKITREINKLTPMPAMILFKYNNYLTVAVIDRRLHKRESTKDVLEKVTLIKDINISKPHRAHIEILHDLSFDELQGKHRFSNFVELHNAWRKTLDTSELNKKFFRELANWYFWSLKNVEFPEDAEKDRDVRNAISVIRMITRLIFIWFVKEKGLIPEDLFNQSKLKGLLNFKDKKQSTYYKAILQNLFFATLNTEMNKDKSGSRKFRGKNKGDGRDQHYMIHNVFRYEDYFVNPQDTLKRYFEDVPFLNGGLFECLDKLNQNGKDKVIRIDGFSDHPKNDLEVPDHLFFSSEKTVDLNEIYGTKNKGYKVRGLIDILDSYKFTVDENTPIEEEIALDPELLGKVFENLLASYNPETQTTARKQTGSFYTPREIVNYMVDESIIAYLSTKLEGILSPEVTPPPSAPPLKIRGGRGSYDERLRHLLAYNDEPHKFTTAEVDVLISAINTLKALDPACGSGAFPMGMLHKLVYILGRLDPDNSKWRELQKQKALKETEEAYKIGDKEEREKRLLDISEVFENNASDYGRKLYLIENCIFGVDIQPIAVQIAKLRFFISLIVDQRIDPKKPNLGVRPLPNLETKFVAANTLIGIEKPAQMLLRNPEIDKKEEELKKVRERHFTARTPQTKEKYRIADEKLRAEVSELLRNDGFPSETTEKLAKWNPYDQNASADFFDPEWMFGITDGFDIVTGNPPYGLLNKKQNQVEAITVTPEQLSYYKSLPDYVPATGGMINIFKLFILKSIYLLRKEGIFSEIFPLAFIADSSTSNLRNYIFNNCCIQFIEAFPERDDPNKRVFESAKMSVCVMNLVKSKKDHPFFIRINDDRFINDQKQKTFLTAASIALIDKDNLTIPLMSQGDLDLLSNVYRKSIRFGDVGHCYTGEIDITLGKPYISYNSQDAPLLRGAILDRYLVRDSMSQGEFLYLKKQKYLKEISGKKATHFQSERIAMQGITGVNEKTRLKMTLLGQGYFCANSINYIVFHDRSVNTKYALGLLNSRLMNYIFSKFSTNSNVNGYEVDNLPYAKDCSPNQQRTLITLVDQILAAKEKDPKADTSGLEKQIDDMVYALYGLTPEEIAIVEGRSADK